MVAETFQEMLQRDFGYKLYKALLALPEKEQPPEAKNPDSEKVPKSEKEAENELKEEPQEKPGAEDAPDSNQKEVQVRLYNSRLAPSCLASYSHGLSLHFLPIAKDNKGGSFFG